jgi:hypothetical protein
MRPCSVGESQWPVGDFGCSGSEQPDSGAEEKSVRYPQPATARLSVQNLYAAAPVVGGLLGQAPARR